MLTRVALLVEHRLLPGHLPEPSAIGQQLLGGAVSSWTKGVERFCNVPACARACVLGQGRPPARPASLHAELSPVMGRDDVSLWACHGHPGAHGLQLVVQTLVFLSA